jgi:hypothetical protein
MPETLKLRDELDVVLVAFRPELSGSGFRDLPISLPQLGVRLKLEAVVYFED